MPTHDVHECYSSQETINGITKRVERWVTTPYTNLPYALCRFKKRVLEGDSKYPKGTFFKITKNGIKPELNKHLKPKTSN